MIITMTFNVKMNLTSDEKIQEMMNRVGATERSHLLTAISQSFEKELGGAIQDGDDALTISLLKVEAQP
jgi:hypothetical protein